MKHDSYYVRELTLAGKMRVLICVFTTHIEKLLKQERIRHIRIRITKGLYKVFLNVNELHNEMIRTDNDNFIWIIPNFSTLNCYSTCMYITVSVVHFQSSIYSKGHFLKENHPFYPSIHFMNLWSCVRSRGCWSLPQCLGL